MRTRIKICGLTRSDDVHQAVTLGVDALGFVFYPPSKRYVTPERAAELCKDLPAFVSTVALFVNAQSAEVLEVIRLMRPTFLQFHGDENAEQCEAYGLPYLKAFRVGAPGLDTPALLAQYCAEFQHAAGWLFDSYTPAYGGSGHTFDYSLLADISKPGNLTRPCIMSGGLTDQTVRQAILATHPWAVDVSSGVEDAPGLKSALRMRSFVSAVYQSTP